MPAPVTYWLLLTLSIALAVLVVRQALEPLCGRIISWLALVVLFCSVPMVTYTIFDDWPETAVTYCAFVACVFAPHALVVLWHSGTPSAARRLAALSPAAAAGSPDRPRASRILAAARRRAVADVGIGALSFQTITPNQALGDCHPGHRVAAPVAPQLPDIARELTAGGTVERFPVVRAVEDSTGSLLLADAFPLVEQLQPRLPFTGLVLALVSLAIGLASHEINLRRLAVGGALMSVGPRDRGCDRARSRMAAVLAVPRRGDCGIPRSCSRCSAARVPRRSCARRAGAAGGRDPRP